MNDGTSTGGPDRGQIEGVSRRTLIGNIVRFSAAGLIGAGFAFPLDAMAKKKEKGTRSIPEDTAQEGAAGTSSTAGSQSAGGTPITLPFDHGQRYLVQYPQKRMLIRHTTRAPQLETPFSVFNEGILTPNDAFFVRYHNAHIPLEIDTANYRVRVDGIVNRVLNLTLDQIIHQFASTEIVAVNQCSGNSRGFSSPRVPGGQWANGAMGNARWTGVLLRDVLNAAGVRPNAKQVVFNAMDSPAEDGVPDFVKALDIDHALDGEVMLAYRMNGQDMPLLNGFPLRLVVPGYFGTYWVKQVTRITVIDSILDQFYMTTAYRIPDNACACVPPGTTPLSTVPINRLNVRSFITSLTNGAEVINRAEIAVKGIAFDGGSGISTVLFSEDGGTSWRQADLGPDLGRYSFRPWQIQWQPTTRGEYRLQVKAINNEGITQPNIATWNPSGYMRNVIETMVVKSI